MDNIETIRRLERAYGDQDYGTVDEILAEDFVAHTPGSEMMPPGREGAKAADIGSHVSFPDKQTVIEDVFGEGDLTVSHVRMTGTNKGGLAWAGIPANDRPINVDWIQISRHGPDGRIHETWAQMDTPTLMVQLGAMPGM